MTTLNELMREYGGNAVLMKDAGNGCSYGEEGIVADYDDDLEAEYGHIAMHPVEGGEVEQMFASDWIIKGEGDNPYRVRLYF